MNESKHNYNSHGGSDNHNVHKMERSYWKRVHLDWRAWFVAILMILAMIYYVMSDDFALRIHRRPPQSESGTVGK